MNDTKTQPHRLSGEERRALKRKVYWDQHTVKRRGHCVHCDHEPKDYTWLLLKPRTGRVQPCCPACRGVQPWQ